MCGDEQGMIWEWDLLNVRIISFTGTLAPKPTLSQAKVASPNPPPKVHDKVITWVEHHPLEAGEMISASADGVVKVWRA